jgi:hypothetical protein
MFRIPEPNSSARWISRKNAAMTGILGNGVKVAGFNVPKPCGLLLFSVRTKPQKIGVKS